MVSKICKFEYFSEIWCFQDVSQHLAGTPTFPREMNELASKLFKTFLRSKKSFLSSELESVEVTSKIKKSQDFLWFSNPSPALELFWTSISDFRGFWIEIQQVVTSRLPNQFQSLDPRWKAEVLIRPFPMSFDIWSQQQTAEASRENS